MLLQNITFSAEELNSGIVVIKEVADKNIVVRGGLISFPTSTNFYAVTQMKVKNTSGATVSYLPVTSFEKTSYDSLGAVLTDFLTVDNNVTDTYTSMRGRISHLIVQGTPTHTSGIVFNMIQE